MVCVYRVSLPLRETKKNFWRPKHGCGNLGRVTETLCLRGRLVDSAQLEQIRQWVAQHPQWSSWRLSRELARAWDCCLPLGHIYAIEVLDVLRDTEKRGLV